MSSLSAASEVDVSTTKTCNWNIEVLLYEDSSIKSGITLQRGKWYASANVSGGVESFYEVESILITISGNEGRSFMFPAKRVIENASTPSTPTACIVPKYRNTRLQSTGDRTHVIKGAVMKFCRENPGVALVIGGIGARNAHQEANLFHVRSADKVCAHESRWDCVPAAVINAINAM